MTDQPNPTPETTEAAPETPVAAPVENPSTEATTNA